jgi:methyl-accepting chemotaxis protein
VNPNDRLVLSFEQAHALRGLDTLAASIDQPHTDNIVGLRKDVMALRGNFNGLMQEQKTLGFDDSSGLRENLQVAGNAVERINENMSGLAEADATRLLVALLSMRHFEADYRVNQSEVSCQQFLMAYKKFADLFSGSSYTPLKRSLEQQVKTYAVTFEKWVEAYDRVRPLRSIIDIDHQNMLPEQTKSSDTPEALQAKRPNASPCPNREHEPALSQSVLRWLRLASALVG